MTRGNAFLNRHVRGKEKGAQLFVRIVHRSPPFQDSCVSTIIFIIAPVCFWKTNLKLVVENEIWFRVRKIPRCSFNFSIDSSFYTFHITEIEVNIGEFSILWLSEIIFINMMPEKLVQKKIEKTEKTKIKKRKGSKLYRL